MFKFWSENNKQAKDFLMPDLGLRSWGDLNEEEKNKIWYYLNWYFFDNQTKIKHSNEGGPRTQYYPFFGDYREQGYKQVAILETISYLNETYKAKSFAETYLKDPDLNPACYDFYNIFLNYDESVVMEMLSAYAKFFYEATKEYDGRIYQNQDETEDEFVNRKVRAEFKSFDAFAQRLNDIFLQFGIRYYLTRDGFMPRQDNKIIEEIYKPVLIYLSDKKWQKVNEILSDSFADYRKNTPQGYSGCVTKTISAVEAFMQILVEGKTGGTKLSPLISKAQNEGLLPNDVFTQTIFKNIDSILARERISTGDGHPKNEYATEKNARTILNIAMVFLQHCI